MSVAAEICYIHSPNATTRVADFSELGRIYALHDISISNSGTGKEDCHS